MSTQNIKCPKCSSTQLTANKKGFSGTQAIDCALLTGGIVLLAGTIGSGKIRITCLSCGHDFKPGDDLRSTRKKDRQMEKALGSSGFWIFLAGLIFVGYLLLKIIF